MKYLQYIPFIGMLVVIYLGFAGDEDSFANEDYPIRFYVSSILHGACIALGIPLIML